MFLACEIKSFKESGRWVTGRNWEVRRKTFHTIEIFPP
jgi:hypothetical protein